MKISFLPSFILYRMQLTDALVTSGGKNPGKKEQGSRQSLTPKAGRQAQEWGLSDPDFWVTILPAFTAMIQKSVQLKMEIQVDPKIKEMGNNNMLDWLSSARLFLS